MYLSLNLAEQYGLWDNKDSSGLPAAVCHGFCDHHQLQTQESCDQHWDEMPPCQAMRQWQQLWPSHQQVWIRPDFTKPCCILCFGCCGMVYLHFFTQENNEFALTELLKLAHCSFIFSSPPHILQETVLAFACEIQFTYALRTVRVLGQKYVKNPAFGLQKVSSSDSSPFLPLYLKPVIGFSVPLPQSLCLICIPDSP
ncbi:hypothetical protein P7K49_012596 [Saguinus oedipus]|uniref:Uncharacterized protein n=1 Tax=Saguinus oedipus TaxID=9490 RepID=A0ABQ9VDT4_SAGOE|nr:hypothetical protein P7K49_012596 [Saguinus oedipus]